jgi:hypothetical protein
LLNPAASLPDRPLAPPSLAALSSALRRAARLLRRFVAWCVAHGVQQRLNKGF